MTLACLDCLASQSCPELGTAQPQLVSLFSCPFKRNYRWMFWISRIIDIRWIKGSRSWTEPRNFKSAIFIFDDSSWINQHRLFLPFVASWVFWAAWRLAIKSRTFFKSNLSGLFESTTYFHHKLSRISKKCNILKEQTWKKAHLRDTGSRKYLRIGEGFTTYVKNISISSSKWNN